MEKDSVLRQITISQLSWNSLPSHTYGQLREADRMREKGKKTANSIGGN